MPTSVAELQALLAAERAAAEQRIAALEQERDNLRAAHERLREELELWKRRLFVAKAERADNEHQLKLEFAEKMRQLDALAGTLGLAEGDQEPPDEQPAADGKPRGKRKNNRGTGRRDLRKLALLEERIEISDPHLDKLVQAGKCTRHGFEERCTIAHRRASKCRVVIARVRYKTIDAEGNTDVIATPMHAEILAGSIAAPSLAAHVIMDNIGKGLPLFRIEDGLTRDQIRIDRATLCRWKKLIGEKLGDTVVRAMAKHALAHAFCIVCTRPNPS